MDGEQQDFLSTGPERYHAYVAGSGRSPKLAKEVIAALAAKGDLVYQQHEKTDSKETIDGGIMQSSKIILLLSNERRDDAWGSYEQARAIEKAASLYPGVLVVVLGPGITPDNIPPQLQAYQHYEWKEPTNVDQLHRYLNSDLTMTGQLMPKANIGAAFAYAYFRGYLKIILPGMAGRLQKAQIGNLESDPQKRNLCPTFVIIIPETCYGPPTLKDLDDRIEFYNHLKYNVDRGGQRARDFQSTIYKLTCQDGDRPLEYLFMAEVPQILINLYEMDRDGWFGFNKSKLSIEMPQFFYYLKRLVEEPCNRDCKNQVSFLYWRNAGSVQQSLGELLQRKVQDEILEEAKRIKNAEADQISHPQPIETDVAAEQKTAGMQSLRVVEAPYLRDSLSHLFVGTYEMKKKPVGVALIINNVKFDGPFERPLTERMGADVDEGVMKNLLEGMNFTVEVKRDLPVAEIMEWFAIMSQPERHQAADAFAFVLMSHGQLGKIFGRDGDVISIVDILDMISKCESLKGKPKIGFVQACQVLNHRAQQQSGDNTDYMPDDLSTELSKMGIDADEATPWVTQDVLKSHLVPSAPDFFMSYATLPGLKAYRHEVNGSFYVNALKESFARGGHMQIDDVLKMVHSQVKEEMKQVFPKSVPKPMQLPFQLTTADRNLYLK